MVKELIRIFGSEFNNNSVQEKQNPEKEEETSMGIWNEKKKPVTTKLPIYLGIMLSDKSNFKDGFKRLLSATFDVLEQELGNQNDFDKDLEKIRKAMNGKNSPWKLPPAHHLTQLFIGGNKNSNDPILVNYEEGLPINVTIRAVVYVPGKILAGIAFPKAECKNQFPHVTLAMGGDWKPVNSNTILTATCSDKKLFGTEYD